MSQFERGAYPGLHRHTPLVIALVASLLVLFACLIKSVSFSPADIPFNQILSSFTVFDGSREHLIIQTVRLPRSIIAMMVGAAMATAVIGAPYFVYLLVQSRKTSNGITPVTDGVCTSFDPSLVPPPNSQGVRGD
ncbi:hypothetical protein DSM106972_026220 [Dulcicalothrix desertica PCC 7102]|uniref:Iron ABC transporter permease n=1 Tax=Dulcicalothrix desertica PCC 7102 TaxID=232991 RepID=A0A433VMR8_9CYAN|nr:iron chelate uptake ABC transporter family permease subunit [Dulcicalothrix desertica]RUT07361.1 hypothetical protein DSM106972_026220 [Dulcicalothrix desertica PCC 7102]TWH55444.1 ABC-type Fe3+-siderophore transport system, permease component [Dulcicalothrix desertica PCC 7102]